MSFIRASKIGLPIITGLSVLSIPVAMNETKRSRHFYEEDYDSSYSPVTETVQQVNPQEFTIAKDTKVVTSYLDGYKIESSNQLEKKLNEYRKVVIGQLNYVDAEYRNLKSALNNEWNYYSSKITSVYDPQDQFLPSFIYALTATLTGSILVNRRSLPVRFITPLLFATAGFKVFLPRTFDNTVNVITNYEAKEYPELLDFQRSLRKSALEAEDSLLKTKQDLNQGLIDLIHDIRTSFK